MGGEKGAPALRAPCCRGSPPRGRGKDAVQRHATRGLRITPAWAGKRNRGCHRMADQQDHPRVGGEKMTHTGWTTAFTGSPPRGRGKAGSNLPLLPTAWITPAWAGKSYLQKMLLCSNGDHPRVGGEKTAHIGNNPIFPGSPPRGRGKVLRSLRSNANERITPAWAGKSSGVGWRWKRWWDHPRVGGEKTKKIP